MKNITSVGERMSPTLVFVAIFQSSRFAC